MPESRLTFLVSHGEVSVEQGGEGALLGELSLGCQRVVPQSLDQHGGQVQRLRREGDVPSIKTHDQQIEIQQSGFGSF